MMGQYRSALRRIARSLRRDQSGVALVEFAYSVPILLALGLGGLETANLAIAHMRVSQMTMLVADNASRVRGTIDEADISDIFTGAELSAKTLRNFKAQSKIFLTDLEPNGQASPKTGQYIRWQCVWGDGSFTSSYGKTGDGKSDATLAAGLGPTGNKIMSMSGTAVMFVEIAYNYQPLVTDALFGPKVIRYTSAFNVRERTNQILQNVGSQSLCTQTS